MKKVRYFAGALGVVPGLGLMLPVAIHGTGAVIHVPDVPCGSAATRTIFSSTKHDFIAAVKYKNTTSACIYSTQGSLTHQQAKLEMRTRIYSIAGFKVFSSYVHGHYGIGTTVFSQPVHRYGFEVCEALVESSHRSVVKYGAICKNGL